MAVVLLLTLPSTAGFVLRRMMSPLLMVCRPSLMRSKIVTSLPSSLRACACAQQQQQRRRQAKHSSQVVRNGLAVHYMHRYKDYLHVLVLHTFGVHNTKRCSKLVLACLGVTA
jgi:hypothetical protein